MFLVVMLCLLLCACSGGANNSESNFLTKNEWKDDNVRRTCINIRQYQHRLLYSESWMTEYVFQIIMLAKKEPKPKDIDDKK